MAGGAGIDLIDVTKTYGSMTVVDKVSLKIPDGQFVALVGASGSGKTTLLKTINRLVEPDSGKVSLGGENVRDIDATILRRRIGYVFQAIGLFPHLTVAENIGLVPSLMGQPKAEIAARAQALLKLVDLAPEVGLRRPGALSGGQQQRVGVARALAARPKFMLMDEPFGALDPVTRDNLGATYRQLHDEFGLTTVMVTHDVQEALLLSDRIVVMRGGRVLADDTPQALVRGHDDPNVEALIATPRRQAERVRSLMERGA